MAEAMRPYITLLPALIFPVLTVHVQAAPLRSFEAPPHSYWEKAPQDAFSAWLSKQPPDAGGVPAPASEKEAVQRLLKRLNIPESSQMLVFSATSLQRSISPYRPRALFFNDEIYLAWVPDGRVEIAADDPELGPVFFIMSLSAPYTQPLVADRQTRCMNCHAPPETGGLPSLLLTSTLPNDDGGSLDKFREPEVGHGVPFEQRFGGWHVTGIDARKVPHANVIGQSADGKTVRVPNAPGERGDLRHYPRPTSDILPQLILEHQSGAVNLLTRAHYLARSLTSPEHGPLTSDDTAAADRMAADIASYFLFANEAALPPGGIAGDAEFKRDFTANRRPDSQNRALKDLSLSTHLFSYRCSYVIYLPLFTALPAQMKDRVWSAMEQALGPQPAAAGKHLPPGERAAIRSILVATAKDVPASWK